MTKRHATSRDARVLKAVRKQLHALLKAQAPATRRNSGHTQAGEISEMSLQASNPDSFENMVQEQLARIAAQLNALGKRLDEERGFAPQRPEEVPGYAELKTALHNLVEHLELAEGRTAEAISHLHDKLENVAARTAQAMELVQAQGGDGGMVGESLKALEERIEALNERLNELRQSSDEDTRAYVDACIGEIHQRLEKVENAPAGGMSADDIARMVSEQVRAQAEEHARRGEERMAALVARLQGKLEDLSAGVMDVDRLRTDVEQLDARVRELAGQLEQKADRNETQALKERLDALAAQLETVHGGAPADDQRLHALEEQVLQVRRLVEEALGEPLAVIGDKLAAHEEQLARLREGGADAERLQRIEESIAQLQQALNGGAAGGGQEVASEIGALKAGLADVEKLARETDSKTREMMQALHETLAEVVERLIALEEQEKAAGSASKAAGGAGGEAAAAASALLGEPAPEDSATPAPEAADLALAKADEREGEDENNDLAAEVAQVVASLEADVTRKNDAAPLSGRDGMDDAAEVDDFIAAARRAALAASASEPIAPKKEEGGSLFSRLNALVRRNDAAASRQEPADAMPRHEPAADAALPTEADGKEEKGKRKSILTSLASYRASRGKAGKERAGGQADGGEARAQAAGGSRSRLLLAGLVLLSAAALIINRQQTPENVTDAAPAAVETTTQEAPAAAGGGEEAAKAPRAQETEPGAEKQPDAENAPRQGAAKNGGAAGEQARRGAAATGLFAPHAAGIPIQTASISALGATGASAGATPRGTPETTARPTGAEKSAELPESIGPAALRTAALNGDGKAAYVVAVRYLKGDGVRRDVNKAAQWLRKAAEKGVVVAMYRLGAMYEQGAGVRKDPLQARVWYERAALRGNVRAMHNLAVLFASGALGKTDYDKAAYWFRKAATHGVRDSQFNLAVLYHRGQGVERSLPDAWMWYSAAARQGDAAAAEQARQLAAWLPAADLARARQKLAAFTPTPPIRNANVVVIDRADWRGGNAARVQQASVKQGADQPLSGKALVMEVQRLLKQIGYDVGPVDGVMGNRTANAIRLFQLQSRLPVNGKPDMALLERLRAQVAQS